MVCGEKEVECCLYIIQQGSFGEWRIVVWGMILS